MIELIIINGLSCSGKSTFASYCKKYLEEKYSDIKVCELSSVDIVKEVAKAAGWNGAKTQKDRIFLSDLKLCLEKWNNLPIQSIFNNINNIISENPDKTDFIFFVNSREQRDHAKIINMAKEKDYLVSKLIVENPNAIINEVPELIEDVLSENYDYTVINNGTLEQLYQSATEFCEENIFIY